MPPPNAQILRNLLWKSKFEPEKELTSPPDEMHASTSPFNISHDINIKVICDSATFGLDIMNDEVRNRAYANDVYSDTSTSRHRNFKRKHIGAYVTAVNNTPACTKSECMIAIHHAKAIDDVDALHLRLHPMPYVALESNSDAVPTIGDD